MHSIQFTYTLNWTNTAHPQSLSIARFNIVCIALLSASLKQIVHVGEYTYYLLSNIDYILMLLQTWMVVDSFSCMYTMYSLFLVYKYERYDGKNLEKLKSFYKIINLRQPCVPKYSRAHTRNRITLSAKWTSTQPERPDLPTPSNTHHFKPPPSSLCAAKKHDLYVWCWCDRLVSMCLCSAVGFDDMAVEMWNLRKGSLHLMTGERDGWVVRNMLSMRRHRRRRRRCLMNINSASKYDWEWCGASRSAQWLLRACGNSVKYTPNHLIKHQ